MTVLSIELPRGGWQAEKRYAASCIFRDLIGLEICVCSGNADEWVIRAGESNVSFPNLFFPERFPENYLMAHSLPELPLRVIQAGALGLPADALAEESIPLLWAADSVESPTDIDLFGSIFFLLSRYEEVALPVRDAHDRYPASASIALKANFVHRPLADEYAYLIWISVQKIAPALTRRQREFSFTPTHDVDVPISLARVTPFAVMRRMVADVLKRRSLSSALKTWSIFRNWRNDPLYTFEWMMEVSERYGFSSTFNFLSGATDFRDPGYDLSHPRMRVLISQMRARGHQIGLHGSFGSYLDHSVVVREKEVLEAVAGCKVSWGRQHYLHFSVPETWRAWAEAGIPEDSSLGFADHAGFRCGTANSYQAFDLLEACPLNIRERPLIAMEVSMLDRDYQGLQRDEAFNVASQLMNQVHKFGGEFVLLWHNDNLVAQEDRALYSRLLAYASSLG